MGKQLPVIQPQYFRCDPHELCEGAACCKGLESQPTITLGDYFRLSAHTNQKMDQIWHQNGDIYLLRHNDVYFLTLSLLHDPCPYLGEDLRCGVYESRPYICATFPVGLFQDHADQIDTHYKDYRCLRDVQLSPEQLELKRRLDVIKEREDTLEFELLWKPIGGPIYFDFPHMPAYFHLARSAVLKQIVRDPLRTSPRSRKLVDSIREMKRIKNGTTGNIYLEGNLWRRLIYPAVFAAVEDEVGERLKSLTKADLEPFEETSAEMKKLISGL